MQLLRTSHQLIVLLGVLTSVALARAQHSLDLNVGVSVSKSALGISYTVDRNQLNVGLRGFAYSSRDGFLIQPGVAYNRYLSESGYYASLIYVPTYRSRNVEGYVFGGSVDSLEYRVFEKKGWKPGVILSGVGKSWQFAHWGIHADVGIGTEVNSHFYREWGLFLGAAVSYRFRLGD